MARYETTDGHRPWRTEAPSPEVEILLDKYSQSTLTLTDTHGNTTKWRRVSRDSDIISTIRNVLYDCRGSSPTTDVPTQADRIYDALLDMGYL